VGWWSDLRERDHVEGVGVDGRIILRCILRNCVGVGGLHILHTYVEDNFSSSALNEYSYACIYIYIHTHTHTHTYV